MGRGYQVYFWRRAGYRCQRPSRWIGSSRTTFHLVVNRYRLVLTFWPGHGYYVAELRERTGTLLQRFPPPDVRKGRMKKVVIGGSPDDGGNNHLAPLESNIFSKLHPLVKHMALTRYEDGSLRTPGDMKIASQGSSWKVQVVDIDGKAFFTAIGPTLDDALALASMLLESESAPWEVAKWLHAAAKKK